MFLGGFTEAAAPTLASGSNLRSMGTTPALLLSR